MWFIAILLNLLHSSAPAYNYERSDSACSTLINSCNRDTIGKCDSLYHTYFMECEQELDDTQSHSCGRRCKRAFKALLKHPTFSYDRFQNCDCQGDHNCVKQKCKLITSCLGGECRDQIAATTPSQVEPASISTFSSTPSETSITMTSSTVALRKVNCETVIAHCDKKNDCFPLLKSRDRVCSGFTVQNQLCIPECAQANQLLKDNFVGQHMTTCKFETPSHETTKFSNLIMSCLPRDTVVTQSPTYRTEHPSRPLGDCKRQFMECTGNDDCIRGYNKVMKECKKKAANKFEISTCNSKCVTAVGQFRNLAQGSALWGCSCTGQLASRRCDVIKHTFSDICSSEPCVDVGLRDECEQCAKTKSCNSDCGLLCKKTCQRCPDSVQPDDPTTDGPSNKPLTLSTQDETLATSQPTPTETLQMETKTTSEKKILQKFYKVNVTCEDYMSVRIDYSAEIDYSPHFTAEDKSCEVEGSQGSHTATLRLKYNPPDCGTKVVKPHASSGAQYRVMRNRIYVRSLAGGGYDPIQEIECPIPFDKPPAEPIEMSFYSDSHFTRQFGSFVNEVDHDVLYLGNNKTVFVELKSNDSSSFILESCFATPNGKTDYPHPHYFIKNGCKEDDSFTVADFIPGTRARFSFYRIMFSDNRFSGRVYVHCNVRFCVESDPDCRVNNCRINEMDMFEKLSVSQGPYTYALALSRVSRTSHNILLLAISSLLLLTIR
ncbi:uncharacterized protein LOC134822003 isoform X2 [Bolinopsis microptera]